MQKVLTRSDRIVTLVNYFVCASQGALLVACVARPLSLRARVCSLRFSLSGATRSRG